MSADAKHGDQRDWPTWTVREFGLSAPFVGKPMTIPIRTGDELFFVVDKKGEMKVKTRKPAKLSKRAQARQTKLAERTKALATERQLGYDHGVADGRKQEVATIEGRRFGMAETLVIAAATAACNGQGGEHAARIVDALAHMMPYRNGNNQRP